MDELGTALREVAGTVKAPSPADPAALWQKGRRRIRRRRATVVVAVAVMVLAGYAGIARPEPTVVMPAGAPHAPAVPENVYSPTRFLAGVSEEGPPGQLAVIAQKPGDDDHDGPWFGISATTGEYRYLDLPHRSDEPYESAMALSADGTRIAYWVTGPTRKSSFGRSDGVNAGGPLPERPITGVAVYSTRTGEVVEHQVRTDFGLDPDDGPQGGLAWFGNDTLVFTYGVRIGSNMTRATRSYRWAPVGSTPVDLGEVGGFGSFYAPSLPGDGGVTSVDREDDAAGLQFVDGQGRPTGRTFTVDAFGSGGDGRLTASGGIVVGIGVTFMDGDASDDTIRSLGVPRISVAPLPRSGGRLELRPVGTVVDPYLVGWSSSTNILVTGRPGARPRPEDYVDGEQPSSDWLYVKQNADGSYVEGRWLYDVDVVTGKTRRLGVVDDELDSVQAAQGLLDQPMVHGDEPPSFISPLRVPIALGTPVLLGALGWFVIRLRRRRG